MEPYEEARKLSEELSEFVETLKQRRKKIVDSLDSPVIMEDYEKGALAKELSKIDATILIQEYENVQYSMRQGIRYFHDRANFGRISNMEKSGKTAAEIQLWTGMTVFSTDRGLLDEWL